MVEVNVSGFGGLKLNKDIVDTQPYHWFTPPKYISGIAKTTERYFNAQSVTDFDGPYQFFIPDIPNHVIDGSSIKACLQIQLETNDGKVAPPYAEVSFLPDIGNSLFESVQVAINEESYSELNQEHYPYKAYVEKLLKYSDRAHKRFLAPALAMPDSSTFLEKQWAYYKSEEAKEDKYPTEKKNTNYHMRANYVLGNGGKANIVTPLHLDLFQAARFMPPGLRFHLTFNRSSPEFYILSQAEDADALVIGNQDYRIKILDFKLKVNYLLLDGALKTAATQNKRFIVPYTKTLIHRTQFPVGYTTLHFDIARSGVLPRQLLVGMVDSRAFQGDFKRSPFMFQHYKVSEVGLKINGENYPLEPLTMDFTANAVNYSNAYLHFLENIGQGKSDACQITMENYPFGHTLFAFDLSNDRNNNFHLFQPRGGSLAVEVKLRETYASPITLLVFGCYNKMLVLNNGNIDISDI